MQERAVRTRRALIRAAAQVFAKEGYASASLGAVSRRAGVSTGALHFHFPSKGALAEAVEEEALLTVRRITGQTAEASGRPLQQLVDSVHLLTVRLVRDEVVRAGFGLRSGAGRDAGGALWREWWAWVEGVLRCAECGGELVPGVSVPDAAGVVVAATVGLQVLGEADARWLSERWIARFWDVLLPALAAPQALAGLRSWPPAPGCPAGDRPAGPGCADPGHGAGG